MQNPNPDRAVEPRLLVTGFGAFEEFSENPSGDIAEAVHSRQVAGVRIIGARLDVAWTGAWETIQNAVATHKPRAVLCLGVAPNPFFRLEVMARNSALLAPDVLGANPPQFDLLRIVADAPAAYWTALPVDWLERRLKERYLRLTEGNEENKAAFAFGLRWPDAGWYLCNYIFFHVMHYLDQIPDRGFIHVPPYPAEGDSSGLARDEILEAGTFVVEELARWLAERSGESRELRSVAAEAT
jgi:pyroglutamyl-peptidase